MATKFKIQRNSFVHFLQPAKFPNKSNNRLVRYSTFILSMSCRIASVKSYLSENKAKNLQNGDVHVAHIPDIEIGYILRTI